MTQFAEPLTQAAHLDLRKLNQRFEKAHPKDILAWCIVNVPRGLVQVSEFSLDDMVLTDLLYRALRPTPAVPVLFLDTLHHFPQTLELVARAKEIYQLNLRLGRVSDSKTQAEFAAKHGEALWEVDSLKFHQLTQVEPLQNALAKLNTIAWITDDRRHPSTAQSHLPIFELDPQQRLKVNPLANWTRRETWAYIFEHDVIYSPLHDQGSYLGDEVSTPPQNLVKHPAQNSSEIDRN